MVSALLSAALLTSAVASASVRLPHEGPAIKDVHRRLVEPGLAADLRVPRAAFDERGEAVDLWESPLVWVAGAVLANLALAIGILLAFRRRRAPDDGDPSG